MGKKSRPTFKKRQKELARQQKQQSKQAQRRAKSELKGDKAPNADGEDPDIGGIRPGPQPLPSEWQSVPELDDSDDASGDDQ